MTFGLVFVMLLAVALNADPPAKTFVFVAGTQAFAKGIVDVDGY